MLEEVNNFPSDLPVHLNNLKVKMHHKTVRNLCRVLSEVCEQKNKIEFTANYMARGVSSSHYIIIS